jgi:hypothetical protein
LTGKLGEVLWALYLEAGLSKRQILLLYLNNLPFGYSTLGVGAAARTYFSLEVEDLSAAQILLLAVIPKAPGLYDPFASPGNRDALRKRAVSLASFLSIAPEQVDLAMDALSKGAPEFRAPHFVRSVIRSAASAEGGELEELEDLEVVRILTTLDTGLYDALSEVVRQRLAAVQRGVAGDWAAAGHAPGGSAGRSGGPGHGLRAGLPLQHLVSRHLQVQHGQRVHQPLVPGSHCRLFGGRVGGQLRRPGRYLLQAEGRFGKDEVTYTVR